jgi:hypothetical protein
MSSIFIHSLLTSNYQSGTICLDMKSFELERQKRETDRSAGTMGQANAFTAMELEAARRREIFREELAGAPMAHGAQAAERGTDKRDLSWLATSVTAAGRRLVRG